MREIRIYGDPVLRATARPVETFDEALAQFVEEMTETMRVADGVGLAAPQVGESVRLAVIDPTGGEREPLVLINPLITWASEETAESEEGCLSVPGIHLKVVRPAAVTVSALNLQGKSYVIDKADGLLARALQHELDHLDGILFIDRASTVAREMIAGKLRKMAKSGRDRTEED